MGDYKWWSYQNRGDLRIWVVRKGSPSLGRQQWHPFKKEERMTVLFLAYHSRITRRTFPNADSTASTHAPVPSERLVYAQLAAPLPAVMVVLCLSTQDWRRGFLRSERGGANSSGRCFSAAVFGYARRSCLCSSRAIRAASSALRLSSVGHLECLWTGSAGEVCATCCIKTYHAFQNRLKHYGQQLCAFFCKSKRRVRAGSPSALFFSPIGPSVLPLTCPRFSPRFRRCEQSESESNRLTEPVCLWLNLL